MQKEQINNYFSFVPLYNTFIEKYIPTTNPNFVVIYIYLLKCYICNEEIVLDKIATKLNILQTDIIKALDYWQSKDIISYKLEENKLKIAFFAIKEHNFVSLQQKTYTDEEITFYSQKEDIQQVFRLAEKKLAKPLSYQDRKILINIYENYCMSIEMMAILFTYCIENGKNNLNYIEKIAIDWCENNIDTLEKVEAYLKIYNNDFKKILKYFGVTNRLPIKKEEDIMKIWLLKYKMPLELIEEACTRTIIKTGNQSFEYANSILKGWYEKNIKTLQDVKQLDTQYENTIKAKENEKQKIAEQKFQRYNNQTYNKSKFVNYNQKQPDYNLLRKIEIMSLKEGIDNND